MKFFKRKKKKLGMSFQLTKHWANVFSNALKEAEAGTVVTLDAPDCVLSAKIVENKK